MSYGFENGVGQWAGSQALSGLGQLSIGAHNLFNGFNPTSNFTTGLTQGFGDIFKNTNNYLDNNSNAINNFGTLAGVFGNGYSAYNTAKTANDMYNFQKSRYALADKRQKAADDSLANAWSNSSYVKGY